MAGLEVNLSEPECFACKENFWSVTRKKGRHWYNPDPAKGWNGSGLHRCHIVPESLGGLSEPSNLFLLCKRCHELCPDTIYPEVFFKWVSMQLVNALQRDATEILQCMEIFGIDHIDSIIDVIKSDEYGQWCSDKFSVHYGIGISKSTQMGLLSIYLSQQGVTPCACPPS